MEDKLMVKSCEGYFFLDKNLELLGEPVTFSEELKKELKRIKNPNGLYFNHFDITKDGNYVYYTDENEHSLFRYDIAKKERVNLFPEIQIFSYTDMEGSNKLPYRIYELLLTPNEQFLIAKVAGYMEAYFVYNLNDLGQFFLVNSLPVNIHWCNIENFIPMFTDLTNKKKTFPQRLDLTLLDLENNNKTTMNVPLSDDVKHDLYHLYSTFNKDYFASTWFNYTQHSESSQKNDALMIRFDLNARQMSIPVSSKFQLSIVALLNDGRAIIRYQSLYDDKKGFIIAE